jgi:hypothetical protein
LQMKVIVLRGAQSGCAAAAPPKHDARHIDTSSPRILMTGPLQRYRLVLFFSAAAFSMARAPLSMFTIE